MFKVVHERPDHTLWSAMDKDLKEFSLQYVPGEKTYPKVGCCLCFDTLEHAKLFSTSPASDNEQIWECDVEEAHPEGVNGLLFFDEFDYIYDLWSGEIDAGYDFPDGTVLASSVTLTRRIV